MATATLPAVNPFPTNEMNVPTTEKEQKQKKEKKEKKEKKDKKDKKDKKEKSKKKKADKENDDPKEPKPIRQAVGVIVIDKNNQKVLLIQSKGKKDTYILPRDDCKTDPTQENPEEAALRLLKEKAGVQTQAVNTRIGTYSETNKKGKVTTYHWMYEVNDATILETSDRERVWVTYEEALKATEKKRMSHLALQKCSLAPATA